MADFNVKALPPWAWVAVVGGGLGVGYFINKRNAAKQAEPVQLTESGVGAGGTGGFASVSPPTEAPTNEEDTNQKWQIRVSNWLIANGYDPITVDNALRKYLTGQLTNFQETSVVAVALAHFGIPPESVAGPAPSPPPPVSNLVATVATPNFVSISWTPVIGATSYHVGWVNQWGTGPGADTVAPVYVMAALGAGGGGQPATFTVQAVNDFGLSEPRSVVVNAGVETPAPTPASPAPAPGPSPAPAPVPQQRSYVVAPGDNLSAISSRFYGTPARWREIYNANAGVIEGTARSHGKANSSKNGTPGWYIYPGTRLVIP